MLLCNLQIICFLSLYKYVRTVTQVLIKTQIIVLFFTQEYEIYNGCNIFFEKVIASNEWNSNTCDFMTSLLYKN